MTDRAKNVSVAIGDIVCHIRKHALAKRLRLAIESGGKVTLTIPRRISFQSAEAFLHTKKEWLRSAYERAIAHPPRLLTQGSPSEYARVKEAARIRIAKRVNLYQHHYGFTYRRLTIRNQKSRFGSCSASDTLSFNYRLIYLPLPLLDYVVVHELCHLRELNHSQKFWDLVAETIPDYRVRKGQLQNFSRTDS